ncbi:stonin-1 [Elgaria multicarinata webbii]|uniref:stonin-1 n=1 Tax=Elgaria multicarinata webbii TaxID=159646 RepID=UPI002FCCE0D7
MFTTNPANWVTFEDEPLFQSPQKAGGNHSACKANGLKLLLPKMHDLSSQSSSSSSNTSLSSSVVDYYFSPGPPSNSPLCTPTKENSVSPCFPKSGVHLLYPIPELSSNISLLPSAEPSSQKLTGISQIEHHSELSAPNPTDDANVSHQDNSKKLEDSLESQTFFQYVQDDCAFSSPFWSENSPCVSSSSFDVHRKNSDFEKGCCPSKEKESLPDQKSLNQASFNYFCDRLEHLQTDSSNNERTLTAMPCMYTGDGFSSFIPHSLFSSQRKDGWPFMLRIPEKKNMMSSRQWGPIYLRVLYGGILQMYYEKGLEKPFKEFQLQPFCKLSEPKLENCSISGKIHTVKIEHVSYTEKKKYPKAEVVHEPETEQMLKLGTTDYNDFTDFLGIVEEELMKLPALSKQKRHYEEQEIVLEIVDNFWGRITKAKGKLVESAVITHIYCLSFVNGNSECFLTLNDLELKGRGEHYFEKDAEKKWIEILDYHFHQCVKKQEFEQSRIIKFKPPEGYKLELMRFRTQYNGSDLPFSVKALVVIQGAYVELQAFINMSPFALASVHSHSMKYCENIMVHFPVPPQWIKTLWTMNLQRQKSLKAKMNRRTCLGSLTEIESDPVIQVSVGTAKYESAYRAIVWKIDRLPDKNSSPDHPHSLSYKLELGSDQEIPSDWYPFATVQFVVSDTSASGTEVKSLGIESDIQPQKHVLQKVYYNCQVEIEKKWIRLDGEDPNKCGSCQMQ